MSEQASQAAFPQIFNHEPLRVELTLKGPIHLHSHGELSPEDLFLLAHIESRLKRSAARLKKLDDQTPPPK